MGMGMDYDIIRTTFDVTTISKYLTSIIADII